LLNTENHAAGCVGQRVSESGNAASLTADGQQFLLSRSLLLLG
jgi:hypothetical protein